MNKFLNDLFAEESLRNLDRWSQDFWRVDEEKINPIFAQRGYEDKGYGHTERIIANLGDFLEKYLKILAKENGIAEGQDAEMKDFILTQRFKLQKSLILFYVAAHVHDIGMNFPEIFPALSRFVEHGGKNALHIGKIIHDHHHYASFIILMELSSIDLLNLTDNNKAARPYLLSIPRECFAEAVEQLKRLKAALNKIFVKHFDIQNNAGFDSPTHGFANFCVVLAILSLLHKQVDKIYLRSILKAFRSKKLNETVEIFDKWMSSYHRGTRWTGRIQERYFRAGNTGEFPKSTDFEVIKFTGEGRDAKPHISILDLVLAEALLQYGDKTEITIARLARRPEGYSRIPLQNFIEDTQYDNKKRSICTHMAQQVVSDFARVRACSYIPVLLITVEELKEKKNVPKETEGKSPPGLNVVIHYLRFQGDEDIFKYIRFNNERDFFDLQFLQVIRFHIPLSLQHKADSKFKNPVFNINLKKEEHDYENKDRVARAFDIFPDPLKNSDDLEEVFWMINDFPTEDEKKEIEEKLMLAMKSIKDIETLLPLLYDLKTLFRALPSSFDEQKRDMVVKLIRETIPIGNDKWVERKARMEEIKKEWGKYCNELEKKKETIKEIKQIYKECYQPPRQALVIQLNGVLQTLKDNREKILTWLQQLPGIKTDEKVDTVIIGNLITQLEIGNIPPILPKNVLKADNDRLERLKKILGKPKTEELQMELRDHLLWLNSYFPAELKLDSYETLKTVLSELNAQLDEEEKKEWHSKFKDLACKVDRILEDGDEMLLLKRNYPDTLQGLSLLRNRIKKLKEHEDNRGDGKEINLFPYTDFNRKAINDMFCQYNGKPGPQSGNNPPRVFYKTCDLIVPASFEILAVLNLFLEDKRREQ